jgi:pyruvate dehydrogenase E2 component (dihydrolipoamide acetyltransferase)
MPIEVTMPRLSDTMEQGTVVKWNVAPGDDVSPGKVIADIETDKATMELEAFDEGKIARLVAEEGQTVAVGSVIAIIAEEGEEVDAAARAGGERRSGERRESKQPEAGKKSKDEAGKEPENRDGGRVATKDAEEEAAPAKGKPATAEEDAATAGGPERARGGRTGNGAATRDRGRIFASPLARKLADERGVDLGAIDGSGPGGRVVKRDVEAAAEGGERAGTPAARESREARPTHPMAAAKVPGPVMEGPTLEDRTVTLSNMRATIARRLVQSKTTIPHYQVTVEADMDALLDLRERLNTQLETQGVKLSVNDFLVRACAVAMRQHPFVNSSWAEADGKPAIKVHGDVNIAVAIALPVDPETLKGGGLVVGVLRQTDRMGLRTISSETRRLATKAREKGLSLEEMEGSTFTISNLGMYGVEHFTAIINPPNAGILAVGAAVQKPVVRDGQLAVGHRMAMTMSSDHRVVDGAMAAEYLSTLRTLLENPATLLV